MRRVAGEFLGAVVHQQAARGITVSENFYPAHTYLGDHTHENPFIAFVLRGAYKENCGNQSHEYACGAAIFHSAGETHRDLFSASGGLVFSVEFGQGWTHQLDRIAPQSIERTGHIFGSGLRLYLRLTRCNWLIDFDLEEFAWFLTGGDARTGAPRITEARPRWMRCVLELLHDRACEPLTLACIAEAAGVHPVHLARQFRKVHGCTVGDYIRQLRVQRASEMLLNTDKSVSHIAHACGFADQSHLTRLLKARLDATPGQLRSSTRH